MARVVRALPDPGQSSVVYLVDEIGRMECLSPEFVRTMRRLLDSGRPLVATIAQHGGGFIDEVKRRPDVEVWTVTRENRDALAGRIVEWVTAAHGRTRE